jgi:uncharacterized protein (TIGR03435 family)
MLSTRVQRIVVDRTGLKGPWDLTLTYAPDPTQIPPGPLFPGVSFDPNGPSLFTALQEQLGLRLESHVRLSKCLPSSGWSGRHATTLPMSPLAR